MNYKYGNFETNQFNSEVERIRKGIFFLLLSADPQTKEDYPDVNVEEALVNLGYEINGLNSLLGFPSEIVRVQSLLESARKLIPTTLQLDSNAFRTSRYRKMILDAGAIINQIKED